MKWKLLDKGPFALLLAALVAIAALALLPRGGTASPAVPSHAEQDSAAYLTRLETRLLALLTAIDGAGELSLMITLESGPEYIYATERKSAVDALSDTLSASSARVENRNDSEDSYIIVKGADGGESPVLLRRIEPKVQGVAIVSSGAGDPTVRQKLIETASVALGIPTTRVSVVEK